ncbi:MAG: D-aminoacylase [Clostridiaceae bacterium]|nr:D-aminoacylase [Clostridiaceae bacterium]
MIDGSGQPSRYKDVAIQNGKIAVIGDVADVAAESVLDATGCVVCPGFIDAHSHCDLNVLVDPAAKNALEQGITTEIGGNCGESLSPNNGKISSLAQSMLAFASKQESAAACEKARTFGDFMDALETKPMGTNMLCYVGHSAIRSAVMGFQPDAPSSQQLAKMKLLVREAMEAGAAGLTSGLIYPPGSYAGAEELAELCGVVAEYGGNYCTHMRNEGDTILDSIRETLLTAERSGVRLVISHHKITGRSNWGKSEQTLELIDDALARGIDVYMDQYPYTAGATRLISAIPQEFTVTGTEKLLEELKHPAFRQEVRKTIEYGQSRSEILIRSTGGPEHVLIAMAPECPVLEGKTLTEAGELIGRDPYDVLFDVIIETKGSAMGVYFVVDEKDIERIMRHPHTMFGTDAAHSTYQNAFGHPRAFGTFPTIIIEYVKKRGVLSLEEMIRKSTFLPAETRGIPNKGLLREGYDADIVVMDTEHMEVLSSYVSPSGGNRGFRYVLVNGSIAVKDDSCTGKMAGKAMRRKYIK